MVCKQNFSVQKNMVPRFQDLGLAGSKLDSKTLDCWLICADRDEQMSSQDIHFPY